MKKQDDYTQIVLLLERKVAHNITGVLPSKVLGDDVDLKWLQEMAIDNRGYSTVGYPYSNERDNYVLKHGNPNP